MVLYTFVPDKKIHVTKIVLISSINGHDQSWPHIGRSNQEIVITELDSGLMKHCLRKVAIAVQILTP